MGIQVQSSKEGHVVVRRYFAASPGQKLPANAKPFAVERFDARTKHTEYRDGAGRLTIRPGTKGGSWDATIYDAGGRPLRSPEEGVKGATKGAAGEAGLGADVVERVTQAFLRLRSARQEAALRRLYGPLD